MDKEIFDSPISVITTIATQFVLGEFAGYRLWIRMVLGSTGGDTFGEADLDASICPR
jgi:hypothetical protein